MTTDTILDEIIRWKRVEIDRIKRANPLENLQAALPLASPARNFEDALRAPGVSLIAEIKRASPSKGLIRPDLNPIDLARDYEVNGAAAISVLTDEHFFQGGLEDLRAARQTTGLPILRKEFIIDPYQVYEARAAGADAVLLIVAALEDDELRSLYELAGRLDMAALVEVHGAAGLERALSVGCRIVGVNNRDLRTFEVDLATTAHLRALVPSDILLVAESGIRTRADVERLRVIGVDAMLVGESLLRADDVRRKIRELLT